MGVPIDRWRDHPYRWRNVVVAKNVFRADK